MRKVSWYTLGGLVLVSVVALTWCFTVGHTSDFALDEILVVLHSAKDRKLFFDDGGDSVMRNLAAKHGNPSIVKPFELLETKDDVTRHLEASVFQPYNVRWRLILADIDRPLSVPPLHNVYVLRFPNLGSRERDAIIENLQESNNFALVARNFVGKLTQESDEPYYSSTLGWFEPYADFLGLSEKEKHTLPEVKSEFAKEIVDIVKSPPERPSSLFCLRSGACWPPSVQGPPSNTSQPM
ncbi:MAG: hypothetical protein HN348_23135 [Proteobacteria bacterium]|jgi:hypothetical protein|nr:hypothetical protein [Pseudomonadota bacterium]